MSVSNLFVPNNFDLFVHDLTASDTITATTFSGAFVPIGPQDIGSLNDSNSDVYVPGSAALNVAGGASIARRLNAENIWVNSANNALFTPDPSAPNLIINGETAQNCGMTMQSDVTQNQSINYNIGNTLRGSISYQTSAGVQNDSLLLGVNYDTTAGDILIAGNGTGFTDVKIG
jgi:hypothetical protein